MGSGEKNSFADRNLVAGKKSNLVPRVLSYPPYGGENPGNEVGKKAATNHVKGVANGHAHTKQLRTTSIEGAISR